MCVAPHAALLALELPGGRAALSPPSPSVFLLTYGDASIIRLSGMFTSSDFTLSFANNFRNMCRQVLAESLNACCPAFRFLCWIVFHDILNRSRRGATASDKQMMLARRGTVMLWFLAQRTTCARTATIIEPMLNILAVGGLSMELFPLRGDGLLYTQTHQALVAPAPPQQSGRLHPHDPIQSWIVIKQMLLEMRGAMAPVNTEIVD